ncbi:NAD(P)-binding protein [Aaosphaeria arxii CBS 175.79]|uniref:NAD(P)-binding protein n=1 Tax=Aaosphaeria arxii CBS 175.79 TaxID=1450172 RepID=A0A6A5X9Y1_9PLEO|nr:NAD(P)-binding protein [Aaosphaeria arxii CBS 175.79]KAF2009743.1 NAD(P)-binding protein [Aaosphaeria arxii CBS 175.79]
MNSKTVLVTRATGSQGKAAAHHLLKSGWKVHALIRDTKDARAQALADEGAILFEGTLSNTEAVESAIQGCSAIFLNQMPSFTDDSETKEALSLITIAKSVGVKHIVHSTSLPISGPELRSKYSAPPASILAPALLGKADVENLIRGSGISWTIIRPGFFMSNFLDAPKCYFPSLSEGQFVTNFLPSTTVSLVSPDDIGAFAAAALDNPAKFDGKEISLASQLLKPSEIVSTIESVSGRKIDLVFKEDEEWQKGNTKEARARDIASLNINEIYELGQIVSRDLDGLVNIRNLESYGVPLTSFRDFLEKNKHLMPFHST